MAKVVESVTKGHPDKVCDQIADAILDEYLRLDPESKVAIEVFGSHGAVMVGGEVTSSGEVDHAAIANRVYSEIGYTDEIEVFVNVEQQSPDIARGLANGGAGDCSVIYGYATSETVEMLPRPVVYAHRLTQRLDDLRKVDPVYSWLGPDGKVQVGVGKQGVEYVVLVTQHDDNFEPKIVREQILDQVVSPILGELTGLKVFINPTGRFVIGGFAADTGLTNRKLAVDTYGGLLPHGGGGFSGKDATKPDRSGAYMARHVAKSLVASGLGKTCLVSLAYAIGQAEPVHLEVKTGEGKDLTSVANDKFDFRIDAIIEKLNLTQPIFSQATCYGHFGKDGLSWEEISNL